MLHFAQALDALDHIGTPVFATHHTYDCSKQAVDPDIDTLPLLAWSTDMANTVGSAAHRGLLRMQHYFFFPILLFSRFSWCEQSVSHNLGPKPKKVCCCLHLQNPGPCSLLPVQQSSMMLHTWTTAACSVPSIALTSLLDALLAPSRRVMRWQLGMIQSGQHPCRWTGRRACSRGRSWP